MSIYISRDKARQSWGTAGSTVNTTTNFHGKIMNTKRAENIAKW